MTCREFVEFLNAWLAGELSPEESIEFERHLDACDPCIDYLNAYKRTMQLVQEVAEHDEDIPDDVPDDLITAILTAQAKKKKQG